MFQKINSLRIYLFYFFILVNTIKIVIIQNWLSGLSDGGIVFASFIINFIFFTLIYSFLYFRKKMWWLIAFYILHIIYYFFHISYYDFFANYLNAFQGFRLAKEGMDVLLIGAVPLHKIMLFLFLDTLVFVFLLSNFKEKQKTVITKHSRLIKIFLAIYLLIMTCLYFFDLPYKARKIEKKERSTLFQHQDIVALYGMLYHNIIEMLHYSFKEKDLLANIKYGDYKESKNNIANEPEYSFIFLQMESFQSGVVEYQYKNKHVMPYLFDLIQKPEVLYFPYMLAYHDGGGSSDTEWSVINNIDSFLSFPGVLLDNYTYSNSFIYSFTNSGYTTYAFHDNDMKYFSRHKAYPKMGFQKFFDIYEMPYPEELKDKWGVPDGYMFDYVVENVKKQDSPFLFYTITMTTHRPYNFLKGVYKNNFYKGSKDFDFLNSFSYLDAELKKFIEKLKSLNKKTYLVIYGDHAIRSIPKMKIPLIKIEDAKMEFVPFILLPLFETKERLGESITNKEFMVGFHDIAPTILELSKINYGHFFFGKNILDKNLQDEMYFKGKIFSRKKLYQQISKKFPLMKNEK